MFHVFELDINMAFNIFHSKDYLPLVIVQKNDSKCVLIFLFVTNVFICPVFFSDDQLCIGHDKILQWEFSIYFIFYI